MNPRSWPRFGPGRAGWVARLREGGHRLVTWRPFWDNPPGNARLCICPPGHCLIGHPGLETIATGDASAKLLNGRGLRAILRSRRAGFRLRRRHVVQNALAGIANDDVLVGADVVINLGSKHDLAGGALMVARL